MNSNELRAAQELALEPFRIQVRAWAYGKAKTMDFELLFQKVEAAVNDHPKFKCNGEPEFTASRLGCSVRINVKCGRKKSSINGDGASFEAAADDLINKLDIWAEAIR